MDDKSIKTIEDIKRFLGGVDQVNFSGISVDEKYQWTEKILKRFQYQLLSKPEKGVLRKYLIKMTGYSRQQSTRLICKFLRTRKIKRNIYNRKTFSKIYTKADTILLAKTDELHNTLSGPATKKILERECSIFKKTEYKNISQISIAHIYNLRKSKIYTQKYLTYTKTKPTVSNIGERAKPQPNGMPGYIRIDSVHQGDLDKEKGVYHVNAVDEVTQYEIIVSIRTISESGMIPALGALLAQFPFIITSFHSDNGSEYVNGKVVELLNSLLIKFTKSRPRRSNDNALAECKNGAIVRKQFGHTHIPQKYDTLINEFNKKHLNSYVNFHRPCFFPKIKTDKKGKEKKTYPYKNMMTPYEKLKSLRNAKLYLKNNISFKDLDLIAFQMSDNEAAAKMQKAREALFEKIFKKKK